MFCRTFVISIFEIENKKHPQYFMGMPTSGAASGRDCYFVYGRFPGGRGKADWRHERPVRDWPAHRNLLSDNTQKQTGNKMAKERLGKKRGERLLSSRRGGTR